MIREGFDCILRAGDLSDSPLIKRRLATFDRGTFASPDYLSRFGTPRTPDDLEGHERVGLLSPDTSEITPLVFCAAGKVRQVTLPSTVTVTGPRDQCRRRLPGPWADPSAAISRRLGISWGCAGRGAPRLSTYAVARPCPLFPHPPPIAAAAGVHRLDG